MIQGKWSSSLNEEEIAQYMLDICIGCEFYPCECVWEFYQFAENHSNDIVSEIKKIDLAAEIIPIQRKDRGMIEVVSVSAIPLEEFEEDKRAIIITPTSVTLTEESQKDDNISLPRKAYDSNVTSLSYDYENLKNGCIMDDRHVIQVECGRKTVTDGIGDHFKIEIGCDGKIKKGNNDRWESSQSVFISAQTGRGKNFFVENKLIPYVDELNYKNRMNMRVLIISNRLALQCQINSRIRENDDSYDDGRIYSYKNIADVITYQGLLRKKKYLERVQMDKKSRYIFVICDEAHFFTSDAMFNPHTHKILSSIVLLFKEAVRVYLSATPYEVLEYINMYERRQMVFYHFQRDYSYLNINTYSEIEELYGEIVKSVERKAKWLIFIDDKEKCQTVKKGLEIMGEKMNMSMINADSEIGNIYAVNADSKKDAVYNSILCRESLGKDIDVLITTSVLDNGVNFRDIENIVVSDMSMVKCLQMVGRARVNGGNERKNLYIKRFDKAYVRSRIYDLEKQKAAYHEFELAYGDSNEPFHSKGYDEYKFLHKYYEGDEKNWRNAKHWFGRTPENPNQIYPNVIAKSLMEKYLSRYKYIYQEMAEEQAEIEAPEQGMRRLTGQKYLEYQYSWFGKQYCVDNDVTLRGKTKAEALFTDFLNPYVEKGMQIRKEDQEQFRRKFMGLYDNAFGREDKNQGRIYGKDKMNKILEKQGLIYRVQSTSNGWKVVRSYVD